MSRTILDSAAYRRAAFFSAVQKKKKDMVKNKKNVIKNETGKKSSALRLPQIVRLYRRSRRFLSCFV